MLNIRRLSFFCILAITQSTVANDLAIPGVQIVGTSPAANVTAPAERLQTFAQAPAATAAEAPTASAAQAPPAPPTQAPAPAAPPTQVGPQIPQITIDLNTQKAYIWYVGEPRPIEVRVSTGGNLKKPNGKDRLQDGNLDPMQVYCGHWESRRVRSGLVAKEFPRGSNENFRDEKWTTFERYESGAFGMGEERIPVPMRYAIRVPMAIQQPNTGIIRDYSTRPITEIDCDKSPNNRRCAPRGGIFLHEAPSKTDENDLGDNVSGGCVRLPHEHSENGKSFKVAQRLWSETNRFGGVNIEIKGEPPASSDQKCNQAKVNAARDQLNAERLERDRDFGRKFACFWSEEACRREDLNRARDQREARTARAAQGRD